MMKKLSIGIAIGLMLGLSTNAFAAIGDSVTAVFAQFNFVVNGQAKALDSPVLVYEGTSYLRTTDLGNMLGYDITYKSDSRTIEFTKPEPTPIIITVTPSSSTTSASATPDPVTGEIPTPDPNATPTPTPDPNVTPSPTPTVTPTPTPDNTAQCQAIRDDYAVKIVMVQYEAGYEGPKRQKVLTLQWERDNALAAAGCQ